MFVLSCYFMNNKTVVHFHFTFNRASTLTAVTKQIKAVVSWKKTFISTECLLILTMHSTKYFVNIAITLSTLSTVAHQILVNLLLKVGVGHNVAIWVLNNLSDHVLYINSICDHLAHCFYYLYADDTISYSYAPSFKAAASNLQTGFVSYWHSLIAAKMIPNANKTKVKPYT